MKATAAVLMVALMVAASLEARAAELTPIDRLEPLPLSFWGLVEKRSDADAVRSAYLRGFFEATHIWAAATPEQNAASKYLRLIQGMSIVQVANLLGRLSEEYPQYRDKLSLSEALTGCVVRARTGLPLLDEETARAWGLKPAAAKPAP